MVTTDIRTGTEVAAATHLRGAWRQAARTPLGMAAIVLIAGLVFVAIAGPWIWGEAAKRQDFDQLNTGPSSDHWFGTDDLGRDILARVLVAARLSMGLTLATALLAFLIGLTLGTVPATFGPTVRRFFGAVIGMFVAFPPLLLALFFASIFGTGATGAIFALTAAIAPSVARLTQTLTAAVMEREYIAAARIMGIGRFRIIVKHVIPNIAASLIVNFTLFTSSLLLAFTSLSFLTLGVQPPSYDWGQLMSNGLANIYANPMAALAPGLAVVLAALGINLCGETAARVFNQQDDGVRRGRVRHRGRDTGVLPPRDGVVLDVEDLWVTLPGGRAGIAAVRGVTFSIRPGESLGVVGESGAGKSLMAMAVARLLLDPITVSARRLDFLGTDESEQADSEQRKRLGTSMSVVFQDPLSSLNPTMRVGSQLAEVSREHFGLSRRAALARAVDRLRAVRIPLASRRIRQYPQEFSGGMRQRVMIAMGIMGHPRLLIADEPTTALDVTVQRQVLSVIKETQSDSRFALIFISHDIAVVSQVCDRVIVMYGGRIVEDLPAARLRTHAAHPYTQALVSAIPDLDAERGQELTTIPGFPPRPADIPAGCPFAPRCRFATAECAELPELVARDDSSGHRLACWHPQPPSVDSETVEVAR